MSRRRPNRDATSAAHAVDTDADALPSLFVLSLPRSLSSVVHERARAALGLRSPAWTSAGEILNIERWRMAHGDASGQRYEHDAAGARFDVWLRFLDDTVRGSGHAYKDVVQPFACAHWLAEGRGRALRVLHVRRRVEDVAWSMLEAGWHYPERAARIEGDAIDRLLSGLLRAEQACAQAGGIVLDFDAIGGTSDALGEALRMLYPEHAPVATCTRLMDDAGFAARFAEVMRRRDTPMWTMLQSRLQDLEARHAA